MNPWCGIALFSAAVIASILMRIPHDRRSATVKVNESRKGALEVALLALMLVGGLVLPLLFAATRVLSFADYPLVPGAFAVGLIFLALWLWLFYRSHADLGTNWSPTLEVREGHRLVTSGVYGRVRHPMYAAIFAHAVTQALLLANWVAGPAMLVAFSLLFAFRVGPEERMMRETFGEEYAAYARRTKRLIPGVW